MGRCPTNYEKGLNNMEKSALTNITEKLTQSEKIFVSDLKLLAGEARRQTCHRIGLPNPYRRIRQRIRTDKHKEHALFLPDVQ